MAVRHVLLASALLLAFAPPATGDDCFFEWLGPNGGNWDDSNSWALVSGSIIDCELFGVPEEEDDIAIIDLSHTIIQEKAILPLEAIWMTAPGAPQIQNANTIQLLGGEASIWQRGGFSGTGSIQVAPGAPSPPAVPTLYVQGPVSLYLRDGQTLLNSGNIAYTSPGADLLVDAQSEIRNEGIFDFQGDGDLRYDVSTADAGSFLNLGTLKKTAGSFASTIWLDFTNEGDIVVETGTLEFRRSFVHDVSVGTITVGPGALLELSTSGAASLPEGTLIEGSGTVRFDDGTASIPGTATVTANAELSGATVQVEGALNVQGGFGLTSGTITGAGTTTVESATVSSASPVYFRDGHTVVNAGTFAYTSPGNDILVDAPSQIHNEGVFDFQGDGDLSYDVSVADAGSFLNFGTLKKTAGTLASTIWLDFTNEGDIVVETGVLEFEAALLLDDDSSLAFHIAAGANGSIAVESGDLVAKGSLIPDVDPADQAGLSPGDVFPLIEVAGDVVGTFANGAPGERVYGPGATSFVVDYGPGAADPSLVVVTDFLQTPQTSEQTLPLTGVAQGGVVVIEINGVEIAIETTAGMTADEVLQALADAINERPELFEFGVVAAVREGVLVVSNAVVSDFKLTDPGLGAASKIPVLPPAGLLALAAGVVGTAWRVQPRRHRPASVVCRR